ncbi:hypothetical protein quinque_005053 [Culex quinquefasciatus]
MLLFVVFLHPLLEKLLAICNHPKELVVAYADDISIILVDETKLAEVRRAFDDFGLCSGARLNIAKTTAVNIGPQRENSTGAGWTTVCDSVKILGVIYFNSLKRTIEENWRETIRKTSYLMWLFKPRDLSIHQKITSNLDVFIRRFNEIQYWVVTEIVSTSNLTKRMSLVKKFIKLGAFCKEYQNLNAFFAIVMGLSNMAVSRLTQTWDKLPSKFRKLFSEYEALIDPSRNHRAYRMSVGKLQPPVIPFMPLLLKDMTFAHEGNKTSLDGLVNFEKMHMMAQTMRSVRFCRSRHLVLDPPSPKNENELRQYISCFRTIDNQRVLNAMSQRVEPRRS